MPKEILVYGSREWANTLLRLGVAELKNTKRARTARVSEVLLYIAMLVDEGFWWQGARLQNQLHRFWDVLQPRRADSRRSEEIS